MTTFTYHSTSCNIWMAVPWCCLFSQVLAASRCLSSKLLLLAWIASWIFEAANP